MLYTLIFFNIYHIAHIGLDTIDVYMLYKLKILIFILFIFVFQQYCDQIFASAPFSSCQDLLDVNSFSQVCTDDMCFSDNNTNSFLCRTISEFSRQCVHAGGQPRQWRNETFCCKHLFKCSCTEIRDLLTASFAPGFAELFNYQQLYN